VRQKEYSLEEMGCPYIAKEPGRHGIQRCKKIQSFHARHTRVVPHDEH
jgi:hypothetical protein